MTFDLPADGAVVFFLLSTRMLATLTVAPPFNGAMVPVRVRIGLAVSLGFFVSSLGIEAPFQINQLSIPSLVLAIFTQVLLGVAMGFVIQLLLSAFVVAGSFIDLSTGLTAGALYDPVTQSQTAPIGRIYQMISLALLVTLDGHLLIIRGVIRSYEAAPMHTLDLDALGTVMSSGVEQLLIAAVEIAFPVLAALMLTEIALGIASRAAPRMNIMTIGFGIKSVVAIVMIGLGAPAMANAVTNLVDLSLRWALGLAGA